MSQICYVCAFPSRGTFIRQREQGLEFPDDLPVVGFRDQVAFDLERDSNRLKSECENLIGAETIRMAGRAAW
jgi:hypothetical protein